MRKTISIAGAALALAACAPQPPTDPGVRAIYDECDALALRTANPANESFLNRESFRSQRRVRCMTARGVPGS